MKYFKDNPELFHIQPTEFSLETEKDDLKYALGATLYMPGYKDLYSLLKKKKLPNVGSIVMCLEDAVAVDQLEQAETNLIKSLSSIVKDKDNLDDIPLIFIRVRDFHQFTKFTKLLIKEHCELLAGFVFPKFYSKNAVLYLEHLKEISFEHKTKLYGMPILEGQKIASIETRQDELHCLLDILTSYQEYTLNIRIGGTDFSSLFSIRRNINFSIYEISIVNNILSDILNTFSFLSDTFVISGPVWEYFSSKELHIDDLLKFNYAVGYERSQLHAKNYELFGLAYEVQLDILNGIIGKTIIHPSQINPVNTALIVPLDDYKDAMEITNNCAGGVSKSNSLNRMNEANPHRNWAKKILARAKIFGVLKEFK